MAMASVMGRSCGYGVHFRACLTSVSSSSISSNSLASLLASCFFLRFSSSSYRNRRLKLCTAPPSASRHVLFVHGEAEQEGSSARLPGGLQQSPATKRVSSRKKTMGEGAEIKTISLDAQFMHASLLQDAAAPLLLSATSKEKVSRRKKADIETPSHAFEDNLPGHEKPATSKRTRKKIVLPDIGSVDVETVLAEEMPPSKSPRRRKKSTLNDFEGKGEAIALDESAASFMTLLSQLSSLDTAPSTPKKATRKKKTLPSDSPEEKSTIPVDRKQTALEDKQKSVEEGSNGACEDKATLSSLDTASSTPKKATRKKKTLSSDSPEEESTTPVDRKQTALEDKQKSVEEGSNSTCEDKAKLTAPAKRARKKKFSSSVVVEEVSLAQENQVGPPEETNKALNFKPVLQEEDAKPRGRKKLSSKAKQSAFNMFETDAALSVSLGTVLMEDKPIISEANILSLKEIEEESSSKKRRRVLKAKESTDQIMSVGLLSENMTPERRKRKLKEPSVSLEDINSQQMALWKKSDALVEQVANGAAVQSSVQFKTTSHKERDLKQDYTLANIDRVYGKGQKKRKEFSIQKFVANQASTTSNMQVETVSLGSSDIAAGKLTPKSTSKVDSFFTHEDKVEGTSEPCLSHEVRNVENSVDKASLTDEMPVISVADSHTASRRRLSEALRFPRDSNMNNLSIKEVGIGDTSTDTSKLLSNLDDSAFKSFGALGVEKGRIDSFKSSTAHNISREQAKENESKIFDKVNFVNGIDQKWTVSRAMSYEKENPYKKEDPYKKDDPISHTSKSNNLGGTFGGQKQMVPRRNASAPMWTKRANQPKSFPSTSQRWEPNKQGNTYRILEKSNQSRDDINSQQWALWKKSDGLVEQVANGAAVQINKTSSSMQFKIASHKERDLQQGYTLANKDRVYGTGQKKRKEFSIRKVVANRASTTSYMQIYGTGFDTGDTVPTVLLFFDRRRFIFNVGEGLHRFCMEHKFKLSKIDHVFLTRVCSETSGGLPGLILTLAEMGESGLTVQTWGPSSLQDLAQAMHTFLPSGWMEHTHCFGAGKDSCALTGSSSPILLLEDELIKISAVLLHSETNPHHTAESVSLEEINDGVTSTVYICELSTVPGKFDPGKAQAKGLKPGYKYGRLQNGESVMSDDGTIKVYPEDVLGPSSPGPIMFLVDCPSSSYIPSLTSSTSLQSYYSQNGKIVNCMIHIGPRSVTRSKDYQSWMENFKETHHIMARQEVKVLGTPTLRYSAKVLSKLNLVCPQLFPIVQPDEVDQKKAESDQVVVDGGNLLKYHFRPLADLGPDGSDIPEAFDHIAAQKYCSTENPNVMRACQIAGQVMKRWSQEVTSPRGSEDCQNLPACLQHVSRDEMELVFLGTGSSQPAKHRNVTGIYVHMFEKGGILLDCGEGTYAQLKRRYGAKGADDVLTGLKCIWISHMHADHFSGLSRILSARRQLLQVQSALEPILVVGPKRLKFFLAAYRQVEDLGVEFLDCSQTTSEVQSWVNKKDIDGAVHKKEGLVSVPSDGGSGKSGGMQPVWKRPGFHIQKGIDVVGRESLRRVLNLLGLKDLCSVPVVHCPHAFAVVLEAEGRKVSESESKPGWKLVFSGDTRPCRALVEAARGATILIHEATFDDGLIAEAVKKNHSMTKEAIEVGVAAQVYRIFLTHFSQRYPTIPSFDNRYSDRTCIAYDMMSVNLADLPIVPKFVPALQMLFADQTEVEEDLVVSV